jgi:hypothetical protein
MNSVFDETTRVELKERINQLHENSKAKWGRMNVFQMTKHCVLAEEMFLGKRKYKRVLLGRLLGRMGLKRMLKDERPMQKNAPTSPHFKIKEVEGDLAGEKNKWLSLIDEYSGFSNQHFEHWFFGKMTKEEIGYFVYKHDDHHLRQFGV